MGHMRGSSKFNLGGTDNRLFAGIQQTLRTILINVVFDGEDIADKRFVYEEHAPLKILMFNYCRITGHRATDLKFKFLDTNIRETDTPAMFGMMDQDTIHVFRE